MTVRRSILKMAGLAPAAAVVGPAHMQPEPDKSWIKEVVMPDHSHVEPTPVEWAQRRLRATEWARENGVDVYGAFFAEDMVAIHVKSMRSWSDARKAIATMDMHRKRHRDSLVEDAKRAVAREMKLAIAPEWMRRFLT